MLSNELSAALLHVCQHMDAPPHRSQLHDINACLICLVCLYISDAKVSGNHAPAHCALLTEEYFAGSGWGYFILIVFLVNMLADILCLLIAATFLKLLTQTTSGCPACMSDPAWIAACLFAYSDAAVP